MKDENKAQQSAYEKNLEQDIDEMAEGKEGLPQADVSIN